MRRAARVDVNQSEVVEALRAIGCTVRSLAPVGDGCPDLLVGYHGRNYLLEVKAPGRARFTEAERSWLFRWRGQTRVVKSAEEAVKYVTGCVQEEAA